MEFCLSGLHLFLYSGLGSVVSRGLSHLLWLWHKNECEEYQKTTSPPRLIFRRKSIGCERYSELFSFFFSLPEQNNVWYILPDVSVAFFDVLLLQSSRDVDSAFEGEKRKSKAEVNSISML